MLWMYVVRPRSNKVLFYEKCCFKSANFVIRVLLKPAHLKIEVLCECNFFKSLWKILHTYCWALIYGFTILYKWNEYVGKKHIAKKMVKIQLTASEAKPLGGSPALFCRAQDLLAPCCPVVTFRYTFWRKSQLITAQSYLCIMPSTKF